MLLGLVSVIIPVYNVENYIGRCIESVLTQTYKNIEIVLIDDGSKDNSYLICIDYVNKYHNVIAIHQDNSGPGVARNTGILHASGEFIIFIDSDDTIDKNHISDLVKNHKNSGTLVLCGYKRIYKDGIKKYSPGNRTLPKSDFSVLIHEWMINPIVGSPCNKLIEARIIKENDLKFMNDLIFAEDFIFSLKLFDCVNTIRTIDNCSYNYYMETPNSLTKVNNVDVEKWWKTEKFVYHQIKTLDFYGDSNLPQDILCYFMVINFIRQLKINKRVSKYFIEDINNDEECKKCLNNVLFVRLPKHIVKRKRVQIGILYKLMRMMFLTKSAITKRSIISCLHFVASIYSYL